MPWGGNVARFAAKGSIMDGNLVQPVEGNSYTPEQMAKANVPCELAHWYHTVGRNLRRVTDLDYRKLMQVRLQVLNASPASERLLRAAA